MNLFTYNVLGSPFTMGNEQNMLLEIQIRDDDYAVSVEKYIQPYFEVQNTPLILSSLIYVVTKSKKSVENV